MLKSSREEQQKRFLENSAVFFIGNVLSRLITFFLLPIYTKYIPPADMGYYDLSIAYATVATSILFLDIWVTTMRYMYDNEEDEWKLKVITSGYTIFFASFVILAIAGAILIIITNLKYTFLLLIYITISNFLNMLTYQARGFGKTIEFALSGIISTIITLSLNIIMIVGFKWDFSSLYIATICGALSQIVYLELRIKVIRNLSLRQFDYMLTKQMFLYTLPLSINSIAYWLLTSFNKIVINRVLSSEFNGYYAIGYKFGLAITLVTTCFTFAWQDLSFSRKIDNENNGEYYTKACRLYLLFLSLGVIILLPIYNILYPFFVDASYETAKGTIPMFLITAMVSAYSTFVGNIFYALKSTKAIFISMVTSSLVNLSLCYPLILKWGINGANISIVISFTVNILMRTIILNKKIGYEFDGKGFLIIVSGIGVSYYIYEFTNTVINCIWFTFSLTVLVILLKNFIKSFSMSSLKN